MHALYNRNYGMGAFLGLLLACWIATVVLACVIALPSQQFTSSCLPLVVYDSANYSLVYVLDLINSGSRFRLRLFHVAIDSAR